MISSTTRQTEALQNPRADLSVAALLEFMSAPPLQLATLARLAAAELWGDEHALLLAYLAVHVPLAMEQGRYVWTGKHLVLRAGHLATSGSAGIYLSLARAEGERWRLEGCSERPRTVEPLLPPHLGAWPALDVGADIVPCADLGAASVISRLPAAYQRIVLAGAVGWALRNAEPVRLLRNGQRGYAVPIHLTDRGAAPDLAATLHVQRDRILMTGVLAPREVYAPARLAAERREALPTWVCA